VLAALVVASALFFLHLSSSNPLKAYYFMPSRFWQMASGALLFATLAAWPSFITRFQRQRWLSYSAQLGAVLLIVLAFASGPLWYVSASRGALITTIGTLLFIVAGLNQNSLLNRSVAQPAWTYLGKISYSLYLWHWPVFVLFSWTIGLDSLLKALCAIGISVVLALLSYYCIEQPVRKMKALPYRRVFAIALAGILLVGSTGVATAKTTMDGHLYLYKGYNQADWFAELENVQIEDSQISRGNCAVPKDRFSPADLEAQFEECTYFSKTPSRPHVFLIGDSHAEVMLPMLSEMVKEADIGITSLYSSACFVSLDMSYTGPECPQIVRNLIDLIEKKANANDIVFIASRYSVLNTDKNINDEPIPTIFRASTKEDITSSADAYRQIEQELTDIADRLKSKGIQVVLQAPVPEHHVHAEQCVPTWFSAESRLRPACFTDKSLVLDYRQPFMDSLKVVQQRTDNFYVWDAIDDLCPGLFCSHFNDGKPMFMDDDHVSVHGSRSLTSQFSRFLKTHQLI